MTVFAKAPYIVLGISEVSRSGCSRGVEAAAQSTMHESRSQPSKLSKMAGNKQGGKEKGRKRRRWIAMAKQLDTIMESKATWPLLSWSIFQIRITEMRTA